MFSSLFFVAALSLFGTGHQDMTPKRMVAIINHVGTDISQQDSVVTFAYQGVPLTLIYHEQADRMRLISPIMPLQEADQAALTRALEANFHSVLDARYAVSDGIIYSSFIHPMSDLSEQLLLSAIHQVAVAKLTFGDEYSSGAFEFGDRDPDEKEKEKQLPRIQAI